MYEQIDKYKVNNLDDITQTGVYRFASRVLFSDTHPKALARVECTEDFILFDDPDTEAIITMRLWASMLSLHVVNQYGQWIFSNHYEGMPFHYILEAVWDDVKLAKRWIYAQHFSDEDVMKTKCTDRLKKLNQFDIDNLHTKIICILLEYHHMPKYSPDMLTTQQLAKQAGLSKYKVRKVLKDLTEQGVVEFGHEGGLSEGRPWCFHGYYLNIDKLLENEKWFELYQLYKYRHIVMTEDAFLDHL